MKPHCWIGTAVILAAAASLGGLAFRPSSGVEDEPSTGAPRSSFLVPPALQDDDEPKGPARHKIAAELSIEEREGRWIFRVAGTTDLPDGTELKARISLLERLVDAKGRIRVDEEAVSHRKSGAVHRIGVAKGAFDEICFTAPRRPFSFEYRVRLAYDRQEQKAAVADAAGEEDFEVRFDRRFGTPEDLENELRASSRELAADLDLLLKLFHDLKARFAEQRAKHDPEAWKEWLRHWTAKVEIVDDRNDERWDLFAVWIERQGGFCIETLCDLLGEMAVRDCGAFLAGNAAALPEAQRSFDGFMREYEKAREIAGLDAPFDTVQVGLEVGRLQEAAEGLQAIADRRDAKEWAERAPALKAQGRTALLRLSAQQMVPRRAYDLLVSLGESWSALVAASARMAEAAPSEADAAELGKRRKDFAAQVASFREYAGLK